MNGTLDVGATAPERSAGPLTTEMFVRYSGAAGDLNPMHYDKDFAQKAGYPTVISQGMHSATLLAGFAIDWLGAENVRRFQVRFRDVVFPGDVLTFSGEITAIVDSSEGPRASVRLEARRQTGAVALQGEAEFVLVEGASRSV